MAIDGPKGERREPREHLGCRVRSRFGDLIFVLLSMGFIPGTDSVVISLINISRRRVTRTPREYGPAIAGLPLGSLARTASSHNHHQGYVQLLQQIMADMAIDQVPMILNSVDWPPIAWTPGGRSADLTRIEEGRFAVNKEMLELRPLLEQAVEGIRAVSEWDDFHIRVEEKPR